MKDKLLPLPVFAMLLLPVAAGGGCRHDRAQGPVPPAPAKASAVQATMDIGQLCRKGDTPAPVCDLVERLEKGPEPAEAAAELGKLKPAPAAVVLALARALEHEDEAVREEAAKALGEIGAAIAVPFLADALGDTSGKVRKAAFDALEDLGGGSLPDGVILPDVMREERCLMGAKAYRDMEPGYPMEVAAQLLVGSECNALAGMGKPSDPEARFAFLEKAWNSLPEQCQPFCGNAWGLLPGMDPVAKRPSLLWLCPGFHRFDLSRFTFEVFMILLSLDVCEDYLKAFDGVALFGGQSLTSVPHGSKIVCKGDLPAGSFASAIDPEAAWVDAVVTVSPDGVKAAWPSVIGVVKGQVMWLDELHGYGFPGKAVSVEQAREDLGKIMKVTPVDPPILAVAIGTSLKMFREALKGEARLASAPGIVLSAGKCPKGAVKVFPGKKEDSYDLEHPGGGKESVGKADIGLSLSQAEAGCLMAFDGVEAIEHLLVQAGSAPKLYIPK